MACRIIEAWRLDYKLIGLIRTSVVSPQRSLQPGPNRTTTRTDSGYKGGHNESRVIKHLAGALDFPCPRKRDLRNASAPYTPLSFRLSGWKKLLDFGTAETDS